MGREYVALDLETTGLDRESDAIIEIGAVRFDETGVRDRFQTLVNPGRPLPAPIQELTGIHPQEVMKAPPLAVVAHELERFLAGAPVVGHNVAGFDVKFLDRAGIAHSTALYDTQELAAILLPGLGEYGLAALAAHLGIELLQPHRALADAEAAMRVFLALKRRAAGLPSDVLAQVAQWLTPTAWPWSAFFREAWEEASAAEAAPVRFRLKPPASGGPNVLTPSSRPHSIPLEEPLQVLRSAAGRKDLFEEFDDREEQRLMTAAVTEALNRGQRLIVEAGTGTGKSLAYLIPAACHALANESRVVVSTSTINLQEQLLGKDIPAVQSLLSDKKLRACQLKGRRNYLCLRRFDALRSALGASALSDEEALLASKVLVWLLETETGDRSELRLSPEEERIWQRLSAEGAECNSGNSPYLAEGTCFLQRARRRAESSHIVVVNHSLLLSDIASGGHVLPPYGELIVDEAHHLEEEASRQFGFSAGENGLHELLDRAEAIAPALGAALRGSPGTTERAALTSLVREVRQAASAARPRVTEMCRLMKAFLAEQVMAGEGETRLHVTRGVRAQPDWSNIEVAWDNVSLALQEVGMRLSRLGAALAEEADNRILNIELIAVESAAVHGELVEVVHGLSAAIEEDDPQRVVWLELDRSGGSLAVSWVPLSVADLLRERLYDERRVVVLTGATLTSGHPSRPGESFQYIQRRLGLEDAATLALGSPFDYRKAALVLVPRDMPEPESPQYLDAMSDGIYEMARASRGRALVLFTSHASLRAVHRSLQGRLRAEGIGVLGQGIDGSPRHLVRTLQSAPNTVVLGTASFWEGVDVPGEALSLLVMARLPFPVPTDPVFAARAELYEDPFNQYALPQAVLRFKQGFGRLIRTKRDRGVMVVLDRRILTRFYGPVFLEALPECTLHQPLLREVPGLVERWLGGLRSPEETGGG